jgi:hypothetical protein
VNLNRYENSKSRKLRLTLPPARAMKTLWASVVCITQHCIVPSYSIPCSIRWNESLLSVFNIKKKQWNWWGKRQNLHGKEPEHFGWNKNFISFDHNFELRGIEFTTASGPALGPAKPPIQWVPRALSLGVKRPGREANHSPPSSAGVKEWVELYIHSPNTPSWRGA